MSTKKTFFTVPDKESSTSTRHRLESMIGCDGSTVVTCVRTYLDSFDSRIYKAGAILEELETDGSLVLNWLSLKNSKSDRAAEIDIRPRFVRDIPPGQLRKTLMPVMKMRALLPVVRISSNVQILKVSSKTKKTIARIVIEDNQIQVPGMGNRQLKTTLYVESVKGGDKQYRKVVNVLRKEYRQDTMPISLPLRVLAVIDFEPGYPPKPDLLIAPHMRTDFAVREILRRQFRIIQANETGLKADIDSEYLHYYRIAVRRTRTALDQIKAVIPEKTLDKFKGEFIWLGKVTSTCRDMDVYLLKLPEYRKILPRAQRKDIEPLKTYLVRHHKIEHEKLVRILESERYKEFTRDWEVFLGMEPSCWGMEASAAQPVIDVADRVIWHIYRGVVDEGKAINPKSPPEQLHDLRKSCKKLRYIIEAIKDLYPEKKIVRTLGKLKSLQKLLGEYQDLHVQISSLQQFSDNMREEMDESEKTYSAIDKLSAYLSRKQVEIRDKYEKCFDTFISSHNRKYFRSLFNSNKN